MTRNDKMPDDTLCTLTNEEGSWTGPADAPLQVHRDGNAMSALCRNDIQKGVSMVSPNFDKGAATANTVVGLFSAFGAGIIVYNAIDAATNASYEYPSVVSVKMKDNVK